MQHDVSGMGRLVAPIIALALSCTFSPPHRYASAEGLSGPTSPIEAQSQKLPSHFDLRERGVVTPVKLQDPWGTCWAFAATAASETSILSKLGATFADTGLDLSDGTSHGIAHSR